MTTRARRRRDGRRAGWSGPAGASAAARTRTLWPACAPACLLGSLLGSVLGGVFVGCGARPGPPPHASRAVEGLPAGRGGQELVGSPFPALVFDAWLAADGELAPVEQFPLDAAPAPVTLYRWWTDTCPYCASSLPALETLRRNYAARGLRVIGVYHPKPPRPSADDAVRSTARTLGFGGLLAVDADWSELQRLYLSTGERDATSASFLVDGAGVIRFVHPGPEFHPSEDPAHAQQDADYRSLVRAVEALLD